MGEPMEERMMAEWIAAHLTPGTFATHVRLGLPKGFSELNPPTAQERALRLMTLPEADCVVRYGNRAEIIEFIVWRPQETLGQLLFYAHQLPLTPGYEGVDPDTIGLRIVTGVDEPRFRAMVVGLGITYEVYQPDWLVGALAARRGKP